MTDDSPSSKAILKEYENLVLSGEIESDEAQLEVVRKLDDLNFALADSQRAIRSGLGRLISGLWKSELKQVKGLYIWGPVGRGKTMLMDLFFNHLNSSEKRRLHFHEFMTETHELIFKHRQAFKLGESNEEDPIPPVAKKLSDNARLLCFDEFSVTDIADAMILSRLFTQLFSSGVVVVATSNVIPSELYRDGLNRQLFLPFVDLLMKHVDVVSLEARTDYRLEKLSGNPVYLTPMTAETAKQMDSLWFRLTNSLSGSQEWLEIKGRRIEIPIAESGAARFTFDELCGNPNGAAEFIGIANAYHTVFIDNIPVLQQSDRNEAKRFINLIDTLYDHRVRLVASAEAIPEELYQGRTGTEVFEFQRTASRLMEMQSSDYLSELD